MFDEDRFLTIKRQIATSVIIKRDLESRIQIKEQEVSDLKTRQDKAVKLREYVILVSEQIQKSLTIHLSGLVNLALGYVFKEDSPNFEIKFVPRRNKTECDIMMNDMPPKDSDGGGALDVASFALRCAFWSLKKSRPTIILDESFKNLSKKYHADCSKMVNILSKKLNLQIILVSHLPEMIKHADRVFLVEKGTITQEE